MKIFLAALLVAAIFVAGCTGQSPILQELSPASIVVTATPSMPSATPQATILQRPTATITATTFPMTSVDELDVDIYPLDTEAEPLRFVVVDDSIWVSIPGDNTIRQIDVKSKQEVAKIAVGMPYSNFAVGFNSVWIVSNSNDELVRIDTETSAITAKIDLKFMDYRDIMASEDGVWVTSDKKGILARIDPETNQVVDEYEVEPNSALVVAGFDSVWVANYNYDYGTIQRLDPKTKQVIATINAGKNPMQLEAAEGAVWEYSFGEGAIYRIDPATNEFEVIPVFDPYTWASFAVSNGAIWLTTSTRLLTVLDLETKQITRMYGGASTSSSSFYIRAYDGTVWILRGNQGSSTNAIWRVNKPE